MHETHVLVLAMSDLRISDKKGVEPNLFQYTYEKDKENPIYRELFHAETEQSPVYNNMIGQLEVLPKLLTDFYKEKITHILILTTKKTCKPLKDINWEEYNRQYKALFGQNAISYTPGDKISSVEFFIRRMKALGVHTEKSPIIYEAIPIDENKPEDGLEELLKKIRSLYSKCRQDKGSWRLWLDTHGGFRDISMAMFALLQVLSATDMSGTPKLKDGQDLVDVTGVYSVQFAEKNNNIKTQEPNRIVNRTYFYQQFTGPSLKAYMNYGQYLQMLIQPYEGNDPYSFISYKHQDAEKEFYTLLGMLKVFDYRYWFDDGIHVGENWKEKITDRLKNCAAFIVCLTEKYLTSYQCLLELREAINQKKKILFVSLDSTNLYSKKALTATEDGNTVIITEKELEDLFKSQHIDLKTYIRDDVLQDSVVRDELSRAVFLRPTKKGEPSSIQNSSRGSFINFSNHPSATWSSEQFDAAAAIGTVIDIPFPDVDPEASSDEINRIAKYCLKLIMEKNPCAVMCQGEFTLCFAVVKLLQAAGVDAYAACSKRIVKENMVNGTCVKESVFQFTGFRKYE